MRKLITMTMTIMLTACWNEKPADSFCLVYVKPKVTDRKHAEIIYGLEPEFVKAVNKNKVVYSEICN